MIYILRNAEGYPANHYMVGNHLEKGDIEVPMRPDKHHIWNGTAWVLSTEGEATKYQRDRQAEYPSIADQLDDIYHNGIDAWKATIKTTKDKYPKE